MNRKCDNCGAPNPSLVEEGYSEVINDERGSVQAWDELWLCAECRDEKDEKSPLSPIGQLCADILCLPLELERVRLRDLEFQSGCFERE